MVLCKTTFGLTILVLFEGEGLHAVSVWLCSDMDFDVMCYATWCSTRAVNCSLILVATSSTAMDSEALRWMTAGTGTFIELTETSFLQTLSAASMEYS